MDSSLQLSSIRSVLMRLEETLIFGFIERSQFAQNARVYQRDGMGDALNGQSLLDYLLYDTECSHARVRRYTSPDEHPFFDTLPEPVLPSLSYDENPLHANAVQININAEIKQAYEEKWIPIMCPAGDDGQYGSSAVNDVNLLQSVSKRIHYGKFVAESKWSRDPEMFRAAVQEGSHARIMELITDVNVEGQVLDRVELKARTIVRALAEAGQRAVDPNVIRLVYEQWVIPMNKEVQVQYLLLREGEV